MNLHLSSKTAFISGSTQGIGFAIAKKLLGEGARVIINGRLESKVNTAVEKLQEAIPGAVVSGIAADFGSADQINQLISQLPEIDILINNVGIFELKDFEDITDPDWFRFFEINVMSGVRLSRALLPGMIQRNQGRIVFISSESGIKIPANMIHYGMTKTSMISIARGLSELTKNTDVTVNSIIGGPTDSDGVSAVIEEIALSANEDVTQFKNNLFKSLNPSSLLQRFITPEEIANLAVYLASPLSIATNGAALRADGGMLAQL